MPGSLKIQLLFYIGSRTILRQRYIATNLMLMSCALIATALYCNKSDAVAMSCALYCDSAILRTILRQRYIATNLMLSQCRAHYIATAYCNKSDASQCRTILRQRYIATNLMLSQCRAHYIATALYCNKSDAVAMSCALYCDQ